MKHHHPFVASVLGCCLLVCAGITVQAQETAEELTAHGREALGAGRNEAALELFDEAFPLASDRATRDRLLFYRAVTYQRLAEDAESDRRQGLLQRSARLYDAYLEAHPDSGAAVNNLAKVYAALGWGDTAAELFEQALDLEDDKQGLYLKNYAEFLVDAGRWEEAKEVYSRLVREQPLSPELQKTVAKRFGEAGIQQLADYLWQLLDAGYARQAAGEALDALALGDGSENDRVELLTVVCAALSRISYAPGRFSDLGFTEPLSALASDPEIGPGAVEIVKLHDIEDLDPGRYEWWAYRSNPNDDPARGVWPTDAFRALARSLGGRYRQLGEPGPAESYYRLAADLERHEVDPAAIRDLVQLYIEEDRLAKVNRLAEEYEDRLFEAKGEAYRNSRLRKIFEYHRTLGELYTTIGRWGDSSEIDSAIFQLEHAQQKSREIEGRAGGTPPERYRFSPDMVNMLATCYVATNQTSKSYELRVDEAQRFQRQGDEQAVRKIIEPIRDEELPAGIRSQIDGLAVSRSTTAPTVSRRPADASSATVPTLTTRPSSSTTRAADRIQANEDQTVRFDTTRIRSRSPLSEEELALVVAQLQLNLRRNVTDAQALDWGDAPGTPRKLTIEDNGGVLVLHYEGEAIEVPFDLVSKDTPAAPR